MVNTTQAALSTAKSSREEMPLATLLRVLTGVTKSVLGLDIMQQEVTLDTNLFDLGIDSMNIIDLVLGIEDELGVQFAEEDLSADLFQRAENLVNLIRQRRAQ